MSSEGHPDLPPGYGDRPGSLDDIPPAMAICELHERRVIGAATGLAQLFPTVWTMPGADIAADLRVIVNPRGEMARFTHVSSDPPHVRARIVGCVHPDHEGRGLATLLLCWAEGHARQRTQQAPEGARTVAREEVFAGDERTAALLRDHGYEITRHFMHMLIDLDAPPDPPVWPRDVELRPFVWAEHGRLISDAENEVFRDHWGFAPMSDDDAFERLEHWFENDQDVDPTLWFIAWSGEEIAGFALCWPKCDDNPNRGYIAGLGVRRRWRGKGFGLALLRHSFCVFHERGKTQAALDVDGENITGAVRLYTKAGMHIHRQVDNFEKELRAGEELTVRDK